MRMILKVKYKFAGKYNYYAFVRIRQNWKNQKHAYKKTDRSDNNYIFTQGCFVISKDHYLISASLDLFIKFSIEC